MSWLYAVKGSARRKSTRVLITMKSILKYSGTTLRSGSCEGIIKEKFESIVYVESGESFAISSPTEEVISEVGS